MNPPKMIGSRRERPHWASDGQSPGRRRTKKRKKARKKDGTKDILPGKNNSRKPGLRIGGTIRDGAPLLAVTTDGEIVLGEPLENEHAAKLSSKGSLAAVVTALASEVSRLRWELERVKSKVT